MHSSRRWQYLYKDMPKFRFWPGPATHATFPRLFCQSYLPNHSPPRLSTASISIPRPVSTTVSQFRARVMPV